MVIYDLTRCSHYSLPCADTRHENWSIWLFALMNHPSLRFDIRFADFTVQSRHRSWGGRRGHFPSRLRTWTCSPPNKLCARHYVFNMRRLHILNKSHIKTNIFEDVVYVPPWVLLSCMKCCRPGTHHVHGPFLDKLAIKCQHHIGKSSDTMAENCCFAFSHQIKKSVWISLLNQRAKDSKRKTSGPRPSTERVEMVNCRNCVVNV